MIAAWDCHRITNVSVGNVGKIGIVLFSLNPNMTVFFISMMKGIFFFFRFTSHCDKYSIWKKRSRCETASIAGTVVRIQARERRISHSCYCRSSHRRGRPRISNRSVDHNPRVAPREGRPCFARLLGNSAPGFLPCSRPSFPSPFSAISLTHIYNQPLLHYYVRCIQNLYTSRYERRERPTLLHRHVHFSPRLSSSLSLFLSSSCTRGDLSFARESDDAARHRNNGNSSSYQSDRGCWRALAAGPLHHRPMQKKKRPSQPITAYHEFHDQRRNNYSLEIFAGKKL